MILNGPDSSLALEILGYEFRQPCGETYDDNWLSVRISVRHPRGNWTSVDPSLQTTEAAALAEWLAAIGTEAEVRALAAALADFAGAGAVAAERP